MFYKNNILNYNFTDLVPPVLCSVVPFTDQNVTFVEWMP